MDNPFKSPAILSFCPGILGLERGIKRVIGKLNVVAYVEIEAFIIANLVAGMEAGLVDPAPVWTDAKTFDARPFRGKIHGIIGGYPCTPFSLAGTRSGENHPGHIYPSISRAIEATGPVWCFFENVDDHLSLGFDKVYQDLHRMGYAVETGIYTAEEVGAPHERERMFILAISNGIEGRQLREWGNEIIWRCEELADSDRHGYGTGTGQIIGKGSKNESAKQREEWNEVLGEWMRDVIRDSSKKLANPCGEGHKGMQQRFLSGQGQGVSGPITQCGKDSGTKWPAGQGIYQYPWEEPRTIESGMGCSIDGYNFREDLLRALGNSVVEQTAELAFMDLMQKHFNNLR